MDADLVRSAGLEPDVEQRVPVEQPLDSKCVTASRGLRVERLARRRRGGLGRSAPRSARATTAAGRARAPCSAAPARAADELPAAAVGLLGARDDEQARGVAVEPVDDPGPVGASPPAMVRRAARGRASPTRGPAPGARRSLPACRSRAGARPRRRPAAERPRARSRRLGASGSSSSSCSPPSSLRLLARARRPASPPRFRSGARPRRGSRSPAVRRETGRAARPAASAGTTSLRSAAGGRSRRAAAQRTGSPTPTR